MLAGLLLTGCASSTGVIPTGPDSYMISKEGGSAFKSSGALLAECFESANDFCQKRGKQMQPVHKNEIHGGIGIYPQAEVDFVCLSPGDARLHPTEWHADPSSVVKIEH